MFFRKKALTIHRIEIVAKGEFGVAGKAPTGIIRSYSAPNPLRCFLQIGMEVDATLEHRAHVSSEERYIVAVQEVKKG